MTEEVRYKFRQDDDCHWYLIPEGLSALFVQMEENGEADCYASFNDRFGEYRCDSPCNFTFVDPQ